MPNWCTTTIVFHGREEEIKDFYKKITEWTSKEFKPSHFGPTWLGNVLCGAGLENRINAEKDRLRCRGAINYIGDIDDDSCDDCKFSIETETAWSPMLCMWEETIKKLEYKTIGFSFQSDEYGMSEYFMYDPYGDFLEEFEDIKYEKLEPGDWY